MVPSNLQIGSMVRTHYHGVCSVEKIIARSKNDVSIELKSPDGERLQVSVQYMNKYLKVV